MYWIPTLHQDPSCSKCTNPSQQSQEAQLFSCLFYWWGNWGSEVLNDSQRRPSSWWQSWTLKLSAFFRIWGYFDSHKGLLLLLRVLREVTLRDAGPTESEPRGWDLGMCILTPPPPHPRILLYPLVWATLPSAETRKKHIMGLFRGGKQSGHFGQIQEGIRYYKDIIKKRRLCLADSRKMTS